MNIRFKHRKISSKRLLTSVVGILQKTELWSMATVGSKKESHINTAYFCFGDDFAFYYVSDSSTKHTKNIAHSPHVAISVFDTHQPWDSYHRGLQLFGKARKANKAESAIAFAGYAARFPDYAKYMSALDTKERDSSPYGFYVFHPDKIKILDEEIFGEEIFISADVIRPT